MVQLAVGLFWAVVFVFAAIWNHIPFVERRRAESSDPEETESPEAERAEPAQRRYFFGPCYRQLWKTWGDALIGIVAAADEIGDVRDGAIDLLTSASGSDAADVWNFLVTALVWFPFFLFAVLASAGVMLGLSLGLGLVFLAVCLTVTVVYGLICLVVRISDELFLRLHKIRADCPSHKGTFRVPAFECECGRLHHRLVPNSYGVWHHRCVCGARLPSTIAGGRGSLPARCPVPGCGARLVASDARPLVFQLAGGSHAGKTVFLASAAHLVRQRAQNSAVQLEIPETYQPLFDRLETWYSGRELCAKTADMSGQMYPMLLRPPEGVRRVLTFYDIGGERFRREDADLEQERQMGYCDGLLLFLDPFSSGTLREEKERQGVLPDRFSEERAEDVVINLDNFLGRLGAKTVDRRYAIPVSVVITKADEPEVFRALSPERVERAWRERQRDASETDPPPTRAEVRDELCRSFLLEQGLHAALRHLEQNFRNVRFYPVSAMGHSDTDPEQKAYTPWGVEELLADLLSQADPELYGYFSEREQGGNQPS